MFAPKFFSGLAAAALMTAGLVITSSPQDANANALARMHTLGMVHGKQCMLNHVHKRNGRSKVSMADAKRQAVAKWVSYTSTEYGKAWANLHAAWDKSIRCSERSGGLKIRYKCTLRAKPCKS